MADERGRHSKRRSCKTTAAPSQQPSRDRQTIDSRTEPCDRGTARGDGHGGRGRSHEGTRGTDGDSATRAPASANEETDSKMPGGLRERLSGGRATRRRFIGTLGVSGLSLSAGCLGSVLGSETTITVGYQPFGTPYWSELLVKNGELAEKYLPEEYSTDWQSALQGSIIGNRMISGENEVGYNGDMPTIMAIVNDDTPISMTGLSAWSMGQQCNLVISPNDRDIEEPADLDGMEVGLTQGSCNHRFFLEVMEREDIECEIVDTDVNTILAEINAGNLDAGLMWEPNPNMAVTQQESAYWVLTGARYDDPDIGSVSMTDEFIEDHEDAAVAYMKGELEAKHLFADEPEEAIDLIATESDLQDYDRETIEACIYEPIDGTDGVQKMHFDTDMRKIEPADELIRETASEFLVDQGQVERVPENDDFNWAVLDAAIDELEDEGVDWDPRDEEVPTRVRP